MHAKICMLSHMMPLGNRRRDNLRCAAISVSQTLFLLYALLSPFCWNGEELQEICKDLQWQNQLTNDKSNHAKENNIINNMQYEKRKYLSHRIMKIIQNIKLIDRYYQTNCYIHQIDKHHKQNAYTKHSIHTKIPGVAAFGRPALVHVCMGCALYAWWWCWWSILIRWLSILVSWFMI